MVLSTKYSIYFSGSRIYGTLNFSGSSEQEVEERWSTLVAQFDRLLATCEELPAVAETKIDKEEVAVTEWLQAVNETVAVLREDGPLKSGFGSTTCCEQS